MLLAIDIGNTKCAFGIFDGEKLAFHFKFSTPYGTDAGNLENNIRLEMAEVGVKAHEIKAAMIASVVPGMNSMFLDSLRELIGVDPIFINSDLDFGLPIKYHPPENAGADRLVDAFAAREKYGAPVIVCDFGTATTIDAVNADGEFIGGTITPGMMTMAESLFRQTAKLPKVDISKTDTVIGDSTEESIRAGIYWGYIGLVDGLIGRMATEMGGSPKVIATGGLAQMIADGTNAIGTVDKNLILEGLNHIYNRIKD